jgi:hypothetical protein
MSVAVAHSIACNPGHVSQHWHCYFTHRASSNAARNSGRDAQEHLAELDPA